MRVCREQGVQKIYIKYTLKHNVFDILKNEKNIILIITKSHLYKNSSSSMHIN